MSIITEALLKDFSRFIENKLGLYFPEERLKELERELIHITRYLNYQNPNECVQWLLTASFNQSVLDKLIAHFTVGETYFFRESGIFNELEYHILPELIKKRKDNEKLIRIWSAGCSTGEEPYSIAILVSRLIENIEEWNITLLATDVNVESLNRMKKGSYSNWSFRGVSNSIKERYFKKISDNQYKILPRFRNMVTPLYLNLVIDDYPSLVTNTNAMDVIFCRNLLMYFSQSHINRVVKHLYSALKEGGYLIVASSEHMLIPSTLFQTINKNGAIYYKKKEENLEKSEDALIKTANSHFEDELQVESKLPYFPIKKQAVQKAIKKFNWTSRLNSKMISLKPKALQVEKDIEIDMPSVNESIERSKSLANSGEFLKALDCVDQILLLDKCSGEGRYLRALILQELGRMDESRNELERCIYLDPDFILPFFLLGNIALKQGKLNETKKYFNHAKMLLQRYKPHDILPGSDGMTAIRISEIIQSAGLQGN